MKHRIIVLCLVTLMGVAAVWGGTGDLVSKGNLVYSSAIINKDGQTKDGDVEETKLQQSFNDHESQEKIFYGKWAISKVVAYGRVSAGEEVARKWLGEKIAFTKHNARVDDNILESPNYQERSVSETDFFRISGYVDFRRLGIDKESIDEVKVFDQTGKRQWDTAWSKFYIKDQNTLLVRSEGVWFEAVRIREL